MLNYQSIKGKFKSAARALFALTLSTVVGTSTANAAKLIWVGDFETGDFSQYADKLEAEGTESAKRIVTSPVRNGKYATELTIHNVPSNDTYRAELKTQLEGNGGRIKFLWDGPEYWLGFSFLINEPMVHNHTYFQIHAPNEAPGSECDYAGNTFSVWADNEDSNSISRDVAVRVIENGGISDGKGAGSNNELIHEYELPLGEWQDYVVHFKLSTTGDGFYKVWKDGQVIYDKSGLTNVNYRDSCGNLIPADKREHNGVHIGLYAPPVMGARQIYYDEVRVAEGAGSDGYDLVAPDQGSDDGTQVAAVPNPPILQGVN